MSLMYAYQNDEMTEVNPSLDLSKETLQRCFDAPDDPQEHLKWRYQKNAKIIYDKLQEAKDHHKFRGLHLDSVNLKAKAYAFARELEHIYGEVVEEEYAPNNAFELWEIDDRPQAGKRYHTVRKRGYEGDADYYRGNSSKRPPAGVNRDEKRFPIHPIVNTIRFDFFEAMTAGLTGTSLQSEMTVAANQAMRDFKNEKSFTGEEDLGIRGVLNYDFVPKRMAGISLMDRDNPEGVIREVLRLARTPYHVSKQTHYPNRIIAPSHVIDVWEDTYRSDSSDITVLDAILGKERRNHRNRNIRYIEEADELAGAGPGGTDAIVFDRKGDMRSVANVIPRGFSMLELQTTGFEFEIPCYMLDGGVVMRKPLHNLVAYSENTL